MKASLFLLKIPVTADQLVALFEQITGRKPTEADIEAARRTLVKALHVLVAMIVLGSTAMAEPLPYPKPPTGQCAGNYVAFRRLLCAEIDRRRSYFNPSSRECCRYLKSTQHGVGTKF